MELLLNLCWLLLTAPALFLWLRQRQHPRSLQFAITHICLLFLLFPVISVTDDLHAMGQEMEESPSVKRGLNDVANHHAAEHHHITLAAAVTSTQMPSCREVCGLVEKIEDHVRVTLRTTTLSGRAPPSSPFC